MSREPPKGPPVRLLDGLTCEEKLLATIRELESRLRDKQREADEWRESWERSVERIGDLIHAVRERPKGRRFATVIDLGALLAKHAD